MSTHCLPENSFPLSRIDNTLLPAYLVAWTGLMRPKGSGSLLLHCFASRVPRWHCLWVVSYAYGQQCSLTSATATFLDSIQHCRSFERHNLLLLNNGQHANSPRLLSTSFISRQSSSNLETCADRPHTHLSVCAIKQHCTTVPNCEFLNETAGNPPYLKLSISSCFTPSTSFREQFAASHTHSQGNMQVRNHICPEFTLALHFRVFFKLSNTIKRSCGQRSCGQRSCGQRSCRVNRFSRI